MRRLKEAGLYSLPGGGGEILDDEVRKRVSTKCTTDEWLDVMRAVHQVGLRSTATMMFGIGDSIEHRVRHLQRVRDVQDETGGFTAFIPWTFQRENTALGRKIKEEPTGIDYLKMLAVSRLFLDNVEHIQSSWLTQGLKLGQVALRFGADDMGSIMIEENVVSAAGAHNERRREDAPLPDPRSRLPPAAARHPLPPRQPRRVRARRRQRLRHAARVDRRLRRLGVVEVAYKRPKVKHAAPAAFPCRERGLLFFAVEVLC